MGGTLADLGERAIIRELLQPRYRDVVFGDDCAVLAQPPPTTPLVASTDLGPAPLLTTASAYYDRGWLLAAANLSDLAAAGATPLGLLTSYVLPGSTTVRNFELLLDGVDECCAAHGTGVLGGNVSDGTEIALSATAMGFCAAGAPLSRRGAGAGERLVLIGTPGILWTAALAQHQVIAVAEQRLRELIERARRPRIPLALMAELSAARLLQAAIDVSDGLRGAVAEICEANSLGAVMDPEVPLPDLVTSAIAGSAVSRFGLLGTWGDWCQLVVVTGENVEVVIGLAQRHGYLATVVGELTAGRELTVERAGARSGWTGFDQERFSEESWSAEKLRNYIGRLLAQP